MYVLKMLTGVISVYSDLPLLFPDFSTMNKKIKKNKT